MNVRRWATCKCVWETVSEAVSEMGSGTVSVRRRERLWMRRWATCKCVWEAAWEATWKRSERKEENRCAGDGVQKNQVKSDKIRRIRKDWRENRQKKQRTSKQRRENRQEKRRRALLSTAGGYLQNILDKIFRKKYAKMFGCSENVAIFAVPFGKQANT